MVNGGYDEIRTRMSSLDRRLLPLQPHNRINTFEMLRTDATIVHLDLQTSRHHVILGKPINKV